MTARAMIGKGVLTGFLFAAAFQDFRYKKVDSRLLILWIAVSAAFPIEPGILFSAGERIPALLPGALFLFMARAGMAVGPADGMALLACGLALGSRMGLSVLILAAIFLLTGSSIFFLAGIFRGQNVLRRKMAFLPFLFAAWVCSCFFGF